jgi:transposase
VNGHELLYLPRSSPNLNLIERLWRFVRKESLNSTYYESSEQFTTAIDQCLDGLHTVTPSKVLFLLNLLIQQPGGGDVMVLPTTGLLRRRLLLTAHTPWGLD